MVKYVFALQSRHEIIMFNFPDCFFTESEDTAELDSLQQAIRIKIFETVFEGRRTPLACYILNIHLLGQGKELHW